MPVETGEKDIQALHQEHADQAVPYNHKTEASQTIVDSEAAGYVDPNLVITQEEDKRLRRKIYKRYFSSYPRSRLILTIT
jgi:hypothetical protein